MAILRSDTTIGGVLARDASLFNTGTLNNDRLANVGSSGQYVFPQGNIGYACGYASYNVNMANSISFSTTFSAKSAGTLGCVFFTSTESNYDKLTVVAAGSTIVNNASGLSASSKSISLTAGQTVVLTFTKDGSQSKFNDVCGIANMVWTPSGSSLAYPLTNSNIGSYFSISNSTSSYYFRYSFIVFTPVITTDTKGRVTNITYVPQVLPL